MGYDYDYTAVSQGGTKKKCSKLWEWLMSDEPPVIDTSLMTEEELESFNRHLATI